MDRKYLSGEHQTSLAESTAYLGKWLRVLFFWSLVSGILIGAVQTDPVQILIQLRLEAFIGNPDLIPICLQLAGIGGGVFLFVKLGRVSSYYRCVMFCQLLSAAVNLALVGKGSNSPTWWAMHLLNMSVSVVRSYQFYHGNAELLDGIRSPLADTWHRLWKWCIRLILGLPAGAVTALVFPILGGILLIVSILGLAALGILELVCLWRTATVFRNYVPEQSFLLETEGNNGPHV